MLAHIATIIRNNNANGNILASNIPAINAMAHKTHPERQQNIISDLLMSSLERGCNISLSATPPQ